MNCRSRERTIEERTEIIRELAAKTLTKKWQNKDAPFFERCEFCYDARSSYEMDHPIKPEHPDYCSYCLLPEILCDNDGSNGLFYYIRKTLAEQKSENPKKYIISEIQENLLSLMIKALNELVIFGSLRDTTIDAIENLID